MDPPKHSPAHPRNIPLAYLSSIIGYFPHQKLTFPDGWFISTLFWGRPCSTDFTPSWWSIGTNGGPKVSEVVLHKYQCCIDVCVYLYIYMYVYSTYVTNVLCTVLLQCVNKHIHLTCINRHSNVCTSSGYLKPTGMSCTTWPWLYGLNLQHCGTNSCAYLVFHYTDLLKTESL